MNYLLCYLRDDQRFFFVIGSQFSLLVDSIPTLTLDDAVLGSDVVLVLGYSEEQSRKAGCPGSPGYGFITALGQDFGLISSSSTRLEAALGTLDGYRLPPSRYQTSSTCFGTPREHIEGGALPGKTPPTVTDSFSPNLEEVTVVKNIFYQVSRTFQGIHAYVYAV
ncbi:hypothetical protein llap_16810 [Limosa lapponica baueri]|uniref:Uncharacterized protein n=1 Tax=Limosa lapponica baueri TaxID=1758121 RepID=A0A2I0TGI5_LIMLA|nr:hypothetical protein llap_16810 [Limosa lapponica baueri]